MVGSGRQDLAALARRLTHPQQHEPFPATQGKIQKLKRRRRLRRIARAGKAPLTRQRLARKGVAGTEVRTARRLRQRILRARTARTANPVPGAGPSRLARPLRALRRTLLTVKTRKL